MVVLAILSKGASTDAVETDAVASSFRVDPVPTLLGEEVRRGHFVLRMVVRATTLVADVSVFS